ncbi:saccharopine dehydrogenase family protein [Primorskyibacter flagellatus]|uniref:saccharopine dehydrogenase family protein n=1 Tax=Primorskyibacter flagellatus TaxID=1387277 RepID=UPI003A8F601C
MTHLMIYGATGYTGRMAAAHAKTMGLPILIAGRDEEPLRALAEELGVDARIFALDETADIDAGLTDVAVLLNCAGPFLHTAEPLMRGALRNGTHYLDIAAELDSYRLAETLEDAAQAAGVMLLPGSGGSVAMLGSLAGFAASHVAEPRKISVALHVTGAMSRGSAISASQNLTTRTMARVDGALVDRDPSGLMDFNFGMGMVACFPVTLPDLITLWRSTGAPDVETFVHVSGTAFPEGDLSDMPDGPTSQERGASRYQASVCVTGADGTAVRAVLDTVNGYSFTPLAAAEAARRIMNGEARPGFQTPAGLFGPGFAETIADTRITLLDTMPAHAET